VRRPCRWADASAATAWCSGHVQQQQRQQSARPKTQLQRQVNDDAPGGGDADGETAESYRHVEWAAEQHEEQRADRPRATVAPVAPVAPPFGSTGAAAAARLCRQVPGVGLVPERMFLRAPADSERLPLLSHGDTMVPIDWRSRLPAVLQVGAVKFAGAIFSGGA
jgi:hypothetical protein